MGLNETPSGERVHIGFFGRRNAGKSSLVNAVTGQELAVVSDTRGTTTDPVSKAMELLPIGPVVIIDTPGFDDEGALGELRIRKTRQILNKSDVAVLVAAVMITNDPNTNLIEAMKEKLPLKGKLADMLMDTLYIGKEAVYRRLRGEVPFTLQEAALVSRKLGK